MAGAFFGKHETKILAAIMDRRPWTGKSEKTSSARIGLCRKLVFGWLMYRGGVFSLVETNECKNTPLYEAEMKKFSLI